MYYFPNVDPIYIYKRKGTEDDPFIPVIDTNIVRSGSITLKEIPHFDETITAYNDELTFEQVEHDNLSDNEFRIDYTTGVAYFNTSRDSQEVTLEYTGTGYVSIPASRVWMVGNIEDPVESMQEVLDRVDEGVAVLDEMGDFGFRGEYQDTSSYKKWNFVFFNNKTYVAIEDVAGEEPNKSEKWRLVSSGIGFAGVYKEDVVYRVGDIVASSDLKEFYFSKKDNNDKPLNDEAYWELMIALNDVVELAEDKLREVDEILRIISEAEERINKNELAREVKFEEILDNIEAISDIIQGEEEVRIQNEEERVHSEELRVLYENQRNISEQEREDNEQLRIINEQVREEVFQQLDENIKNSLDDATEAIETANQTMNEYRETIEQYEQTLEDKEAIIFGELERIGNFRYVGEYDPEREYKAENIVSYDGKTYIALRDTEGDEIADEDAWAIFSERGRDSVEISIEGVFPGEDGDISLDELDVVRNSEYEERNEELDETIGDLEYLSTLHKTSLVGAINELKKKIDDIMGVLD